MIDVDLHGYNPNDLGCQYGRAESDSLMQAIVRQAWEMGHERLRFIHGHGRNRGLSPGFVNTNTGYFGLCIRRTLRGDTDLRQWVFHTTVECGDIGCTTVRLKPNSTPTRKEFDCF
jgi:hypothetical protein